MKNYKEDTLYIANSIADRYILKLAEELKQPLCLMNLAVISILMAAKLEQSVSPSFNRMIKLVKEEWGVHIEK